MQVLLLHLLLLCLLGGKRDVEAESSASSKIPANNFPSALNEIDNKSRNNRKVAKIPVVIGVDGGTESIRACCFHAETGQVLGPASAVPYKTSHPESGWAEQNPTDWYNNLGQAVRSAIKPIKNNRKYDIKGICIDTTCCSVVMMNRTTGRAIRPCILWMDQRSAKQSAYIMNVCNGDPALQVNSGGAGPISAEWLLCKSLWLYENEPNNWLDPSTVICEYQDYINYQLTSEFVASSCNAATRWHWNGVESIKEPDTNNPFPGRPISLYKKLGIPELAAKLPPKCLPMASIIGPLTVSATKHLGLSASIPVIQGGPDAFVGMIGLGCINNGQLCLITGSSHLHCIITSKPSTDLKIWGAYRGAPLPSLNFAEGGQSSTGSIIRWVREKIFRTTKSYAELDILASRIPPGSEGLVALETFQGSRTPVTDPLARGALIGLSLSHTDAHLYRALLEAVCYGTRACIEGLEDAGHICNEIILAGGITRSKLWLQMHADITNKPIVVCENCDAPLLGCAILAAVGVGIHASVDDAVKTMVRTAQRIEPNPTTAAIYDKLYKEVYVHIANDVRPITHALHKTQSEIKLLETTLSLSGGSAEAVERGGLTENHTEEHTTKVTVSPSLLACDWANIGSEIDRCIRMGLRRFHVDIFDGVYLDSPYALTFGPQMVQAIRNYLIRSNHNNVELDLHICVDRPARYVTPMAAAGGTRFIFQYEVYQNNIEDAQSLIRSIVDSGLKCGISINPSTPVDVVYPLLQTGLVDVVDILAVEPGFGGQKFQSIALEKIHTLQQWRQGAKMNFDIMVDGGVNDTTIHMIQQAAVATGNDDNNTIIAVAGSFLFQNSQGLESGIAALRGSPSS